MLRRDASLTVLPEERDPLWHGCTGVQATVALEKALEICWGGAWGRPGGQIDGVGVGGKQQHQEDIP